MVALNKLCTKCRCYYPMSTEYFHHSMRNKDGFYSWCKMCKNKKNREYRRQNVKNIKNYHEEYYQTLSGYLRHTYSRMKQRCKDNPGSPDYNYYTGRGIKLLFNSVDEFIDYVINELQIDPRGLQIDRIDNDGHYEKGNIRFVTAKVNANNRRKK